MTYAADTSVTPERSRGEIERTLTRYGASGFMYGWDADRAVVGFVVAGRQVRFQVEMPDREDPKFKWSNHKPPRRNTVNAQHAAHEQAVRQRWRALNLVIKAKLEAIEAGISTFENEFLAQLVLPNGRTVGEEFTPALLAGIDANEMPALLPEFDPRAALTGGHCTES